MKKIFVCMLALLMVLGMAACGSKSEEKKTKITMGSSGLYTDMVDIIAELMKDKGYTVELFMLDSNSAGADTAAAGDLDSFIYNHKPWIIQYNESNKTDLTMVKELYYGRAALYSKTCKTIDELPQGAKICIPNDSVNMENTLLFLQENGLIKLGEGDGKFLTTLDIVENPKNIEFVEAEIAVTARSIDDCDAVVCTAIAISEAGLDPNAFLAENMSKKDYPVGLTVRGEDKDEEWVKALVEVLETEEFRTEFDKIYNGRLVLF